jgi:hypothetical protein
VEAANGHCRRQLWVLATSVEVNPFQEQALRDTGENVGLAVLSLDSAAARPELPEIASIVALCASAPDETLNALSRPEWRDAKLRVNVPPLDEARDELEKIRALPQFTEWLTHFRATLTGLPLWSPGIDRQNRRLSQNLEADADMSFGAEFDPRKLVPRTVGSELNTWFSAAMVTSDLRRQCDMKAGSTPWCVIVLDGLNEYAPNPDRWLAP